MRPQLAACLSLLLACGPSLSLVPPSVGEAFPDPEPVVLQGLDDGEQPLEFRLLPGDVVTFRSEASEVREVTGLVVDASGALRVPVAGSVEVGGKTLAEAEQLVQTAVRRFERFAVVSLSLTQPDGHRATTNGALANPGSFVLRPQMRLAELVALAGGPRLAPDGEAGLVSADIASARLVREGVTLPISLERALLGDPRHNVHVRAGDVLFVPSVRVKHIAVLGLVGQPKSFPFRPGLRLTEALALAGGTTADADAGDLRIIRGDQANPRVYVASLSAIVAGESPDVQLQAGDVVFVTEHWFATATNVLNRVAPLLTAASVGNSLIPR
jgi:polysaccharide export outer membrane protein